MSLSQRPFLHNTSIPVVILLSCLVVSHVLDFPVLARFGFLVFVAMVSHHLRDAHRRGLWLPPVGDAIPIPYSFYVLLVSALPHLVRLYFFRFGERPEVQSQNGTERENEGFNVMAEETV